MDAQLALSPYVYRFEHLLSETMFTICIGLGIYSIIKIDDYVHIERTIKSLETRISALKANINLRGRRDWNIWRAEKI
jgi:hypothetical protein